MELDMTAVAPVDRYRVMIQAIVPRPVAWVLSANAEGGAYNLAPFSYFNALHSHPPLTIMSVGNKQDKTHKDTRANIERTKEFVIHIPSVEHAELVTKTSLPFPAGVSEVEEAAIETIDDWSGGFALPRIKSCKIAMACTLERVVEVGKNRQGLLFGEIQRMYIADEVLTGSDPVGIDVMKLDPLARLGGNDYGFLGGVKTVDRPEYSPG